MKRRWAGDEDNEFVALVFSNEPMTAAVLDGIGWHRLYALYANDPVWTGRLDRGNIPTLDDDTRHALADIHLRHMVDKTTGPQYDRFQTWWDQVGGAWTGSNTGADKMAPERRRWAATLAKHGVIICRGTPDPNPDGPSKPGWHICGVTPTGHAYGKNLIARREYADQLSWLVHHTDDDAAIRDHLRQWKKVFP